MTELASMEKTILYLQKLSSYLLFIFVPLCGWSQIELPAIFSDHLVLQRELPIPVWGTATADAFVEVRINQNKRSIKADYFGNWKVSLPPMKAGGPFELVIQSEDEIVRIIDIYIGEVWLCSGQSNMEWPLKNCAEGKQEISNANNPLIRFFHLKKKHDTYKTPYTQEELTAFTKGDFFYTPKWETCTPESAAAFSGVGYFFGKTLFDSLKVPIGLIQNAVGGSPAQSWISKAALASHPQLQSLGNPPIGKTWLDAKIIHPWLAERAKENWVNWNKKEVTALPGHPFAPAYLFDYAIKPLAPYAIRGAIWYQGESNATHPASYPAMMEMMLQDWRTIWGLGDFPFYFVQLPKIGNRSRWAEFRAAQEHGLSIKNTQMVVAIDEGHSTDVHPREKRIIGQRLSQLALANTYQKNIRAESPKLNSFNWMETEKKIELYFDYTFDGLAIKNGELAKGFYLQGYLNRGMLETIIPPNKIELEKNKITLVYPADFLPVKVKYAWAPAPENNIVNSAGLPLAPFKIELDGNN